MIRLVCQLLCYSPLEKLPRALWVIFHQFLCHGVFQPLVLVFSLAMQYFVLLSHSMLSLVLSSPNTPAAPLEEGTCEGRVRERKTHRTRCSPAPHLQGKEDNSLLKQVLRVWVGEEMPLGPDQAQQGA